MALRRYLWERSERRPAACQRVSVAGGLRGCFAAPSSPPWNDPDAQRGVFEETVTAGTPRSALRNNTCTY